DAGMLQEAADQTLGAYAVRQPRYSRAQAAYAAHHEVDLDAGMARLVERVDDLPVDEGVHLHPDGPAAPRLGMADLVADVGEDARANAVRAGGHGLDLGGLGIAGDEVEDARHVAADHRVGREEREVTVDLRRYRMVVARADMAIGGNLGPLLAH